MQRNAMLACLLLVQLQLRCCYARYALTAGWKPSIALDAGASQLSHHLRWQQALQPWCVCLTLTSALVGMAFGFAQAHCPHCPLLCYAV